VAAAALLTGGAAAASYAAAIAEADARIGTGSTTIPTRFGTLEYAEAGSGEPLLMIHGTGGGFDQGLGFTRRLVGAGYRVIAPSRFGYLRSDFPDDPSSENQADAFVELLDALGIDKLPVAGGSAGALSAIQFALRHPDRCQALIPIVPATYAPQRPTAGAMTGAQETAMRAMLGSDLLFWSALNLVPDQMIGTLLATDPAIVAAAAPDEQARARKILWDILPVSRRSRGLLNDAALAGNPAQVPLSNIHLPTLTISVEDDRFGTCDAARYIAAQVPGARLVTYPSGGHIWIGHDVELFAEIDRFVRAL
jgi:pimeloyl-ACP methyl ester carboxylesterase